MKTVYVPIPSYPWPRVLSPFTEFPEEEKWLREDYNFLDEETISRYRKQRLYDFVLICGRLQVILKSCDPYCGVVTIIP